MGTTSEKKLNEALEKARGVGLVEETFTIGDCEVTLRNLRPDEYEAVLDECKELEELTYLNKFQEGHVCRAIQELNGTSLRDIEYVECDEPDPKKQGQTRTIKRERHEWLRRNVLKTWGKEALFTAYRKFSDVVIQAEAKAKEGVTFITPDETAEERFRRLASELKELEGEIPPALVQAILQENGYTHYTEQADREALNKLDSLTETEEAPPATPPEPPPAPAPVQAPSQVSAEAIRRRVPLNQDPSEPPPEAPVVAPIPTPPATPITSKRSLDFLAQEAEFDPNLRSSLPIGVVPPGGGVIAPEFAKEAQPLPERMTASDVRPKQEHSDPTQLAGIIEKPPTGGLNPKFRPPPR